MYFYSCGDLASLRNREVRIHENREMRAIHYFLYYYYYYVGRDSSVGIATRYELDGPGIESRWGGEIFSTHPDRPWGLPSLLYNGYRVIPGG
jgi:hypothetical protein